MVQSDETGASEVEHQRQRLRSDPVLDMLDDLDERFGMTDEASREEARRWFVGLTREWP